ncbi:MAG: hypothetical protein ACYDAZ_07550 [Thermoplasmataceae archaeon]
MDDLLKFLGEPFLLDDTITDEIPISFIADDFPEGSVYQRSVISVDDIADEIGLKHEIILISPAVHRGKFSMALEMETKIESVSVVQCRGRNRGEALRRALNESRGRIIVFFSTREVYDPAASDILIEFIRNRDKKLLVSNFTAFPRSLLEVTGDMAEFRYGSLSNLYSRIARIFGVIVCQVPNMGPVIVRSGFSRLDSNRSERHSFLGNVDTIVANGLGIRDSMSKALIHNSMTVRFLLSLYYGLCGIVGKIEYLFMKRPLRGKFVHLVESAFESMVLEEYKRFTPDIAPEVVITFPDFQVVKRNSDLWHRTGGSLSRYLRIGDSSAVNK